MTVGELLRRVPRAELVEWQAYFALEAEEARAAFLQQQAQAKLAARQRPPQ